MYLFWAFKEYLEGLDSSSLFLRTNKHVHMLKTVLYENHRLCLMKTTKQWQAKTTLPKIWKDLFMSSEHTHAVYKIMIASLLHNQFLEFDVLGVCVTLSRGVEGSEVLTNLIQPHFPSCSNGQSVLYIGLTFSSSLSAALSMCRSDV